MQQACSPQSCRTDRRAGAAREESTSAMRCWPSSACTGASDDPTGRRLRWKSTRRWQHCPSSMRSGEASLAVRVGVHTGPIPVTMMNGADDFVVTGDTVKHDGRGCKRPAPLGSVLIWHDAWRHVQGLFDVETRKGAAVEGKAGPVGARGWMQSSRAIRSICGVSRVSRGVIGECSGLQRSGTPVRGVIASTASCRLITVVGEGGVGGGVCWASSAVELRGHRQETVYVLEGRACDSEREPLAGLLRDMLAARFGIRRYRPADPKSAANWKPA